MAHLQLGEKEGKKKRGEREKHRSGTEAGKVRERTPAGARRGREAAASCSPRCSAKASPRQPPAPCSEIWLVASPALPGAAARRRGAAKPVGLSRALGLGRCEEGLILWQRLGCRRAPPKSLRPLCGSLRRMVAGGGGGQDGAAPPPFIREVQQGLIQAPAFTLLPSWGGSSLPSLRHPIRFSMQAAIGAAYIYIYTPLGCQGMSCPYKCTVSACSRSENRALSTASSA